MLTFYTGDEGSAVYVDRVQTSIGTLKVVGSENGICEVSWLGLEDYGQEEARSSGASVPDELLLAAKGWVNEACVQLRQYFAGKRTEFTLQVCVHGTAFQEQVWRSLAAIPFAQTRSYKDIAVSVGRPQAVRAVGQANRRNPVSVVIPCHRVIGSGGQLTGYAGHHVNIKQDLLDLEQKAWVRLSVG